MKTKDFTRTALLTALAAVLTMFPRIPSPTGYVHFGDSIIYLAAAFFGPIPAAIVGAVGHSFADIISGYPIYAFPTFIIKGVVGYAVGKILYNSIYLKHIIFAAVSALAIVTFGYFLAEIPMYGIETAVVALISTPIQWVMSVIATALFIPIVKKVVRRSDKE